MRRSLGLTCCALALAWPASAGATYSAPLMRVRVDQRVSTHTPALLFSSALGFSASEELDLKVTGAQYIFEREWASGWGLQLGAALGWARLSAKLTSPAWATPHAPQGDGVLVGGQLRVYKMLWSGFLSSRGVKGQDRPHALTAFVNLRSIFYTTSGSYAPGTGYGASSWSFSGSFFSLSAGVGLMAELAVANYLSILPYLWFSPSLARRDAYSLGSVETTTTAGPAVREPLRFGLDLWLYTKGARSEDHATLSVIASLIDTQGRGNRELSAVLSYTFD